ncbi:RNA polymerase sigma-70 factor [Flavivirga aquatica]|uniref:RNA polymerase sigma-70 factor n=1 Tax=Flavivirga aquatica TaxID=1849968 RepID=A0A1E5TC52_9FLAO|nr:RNA polymerase sigma-70 factor [Flavivirga aquatica]OEK08954.1 RNA polymerase sigma-70 factor [Flavivirga aquatica]
MNEKDAINFLRKGDKTAFKYLFELFYERLVAYIITYTNDKMLAEDIVQQVFVNLWNGRAKLNDIKNPKGYLYSMVYNLFIDSRKHEKKANKLLDTIYENALRERIKEDNRIIDLRIKKMNVAIETLPPKCKKILKMNKMQGYKYKEIAQILGISIKTVENQMGLAYKKIRKAFDKNPLILLLIRSKKIF